MKLSKNQKRIIGLGSIYLGVTFFTILLLVNGNLNSWQEKLTDRFYVKSEPIQNIVILEIDSESINKIGAWPWPREIFAQIISKIHNAKVIGVDVSFSENSRVGTQDDEKLKLALENAQKDTTVILPVQLLPREKVSDRPLAIFEPYVQVGFVNIDTESDGIARVSATKRSWFLSFGSQIASVVKKTENPESFRIDFKGPQKTFLSIPVVDLLSDKLPKNFFEDSIVLIGATANDLHDYFSTPFGLMPGVEIHANAIETILNGRFRIPLTNSVSIATIAVLNLLALLYITKIKRFSILIPSLLLLGVGINLIGIFLFSRYIVFPSVYVTLGLLLTSFIVLVWEFISESKDRKFIKSTFEYYLMPEIINELLNDPTKLKLGGEKKKLTILFSDIAGFTTISEKLMPEELTHFMNEYLTAMTDIVMDNGGLVDKYIGDAIMAFWGAPLPNENQENSAVKSAIEMTKKLEELNKAWQAKGYPPIHARIGVNTGNAVVGNMGSAKRFNYTVMGDEVNFASRLEGINNYYGTSIIVSENTKIGLKDFHTREIDKIKVKGKKEAKKIFEVFLSKPDENKEKIIQSFKNAKDYYNRGDFETASRLFTDTLALGDDSPSKTFLERSNKLKTEKPENWEGVYEFHSK